MGAFRNIYKKEIILIYSRYKQIQITTQHSKQSIKKYISYAAKPTNNTDGSGEGYNTRSKDSPNQKTTVSTRS